MADLYHEKQKLYRCGLHAVNNILQRKEFTTKDFNRICSDLKKNSGKSSMFNPHRGWFNMGYYDVNVLAEALTSRGYEMQWFDMRKKPTEIEFDSPLLIGFIVNTTIENFASYIGISKDNHWIALLKKDGEYYNLDSKMDSPHKFISKIDLCEYLYYIKQSQGHIFLVQKPGL